MTAEVKDPAAAYLRRRRAAVAAHATEIGIDWAEVTPGASPSQRVLILHFIPATTANQGKLGVLTAVTAANLRFTVGGEAAGTSLQATAVTAVTTAADPQLKVTLSLGTAGPLAVGGTPVIGVELTGVSGLDPFFARASFSLDPAPREADCLPLCPLAPAPVPDAPIDYQARDWASFRRLMLDRLTVLLPDWSEDSPADLWVTLVELLADAADQVSYFQDAVATEAYLGTARLRVSVRRHARLAGYRMHEGAGARVWVQLQTSSAAGTTVPAGTAVLSRIAGTPLRLNPASPELDQALAASPIVFETLDAATVYAAHGTLALYDWGAPEYGLAVGATAATLRGQFPNLKPGDVLVLAETKGPA
ncbi:MAG TPA: putative baseplate assembly protein, partial [Thermoanaerobaculia bacterium]|nr:putative baseplate assembly protein [Thermoanaerobaculia bacterium]